LTVPRTDVSGRTTKTSFATLLTVVGVVYGDIGTSPLYALKASLRVFGDVPFSETEILGILSLFFWSLVMIVTVKYVTLIMRADNQGEGGILALMALSQRVTVNAGTRAILGLVGIVGACLFFGDGVITPAISVLSAVEGLEVAAPSLKEFVLPISLAVIIALFAVQYRGTHNVGRIFGPVMAAWFLMLAVLGIMQIVHRPSVLLGLLPTYAISLCVAYKGLAFLVLGAVVLCVTGAEALYVDMGHFGRQPIRLSWLFVVLPSLVLNYFGQGALLLRNPAAVENPFFLMAPEWSRLPLVFMATAATVIASQAVISGAYSATRQCMQLGILPRLTVMHTSTTEEGQIYVPQVNFALLIGVVVLVALFKTSSSLASAYGIAVTGTFMCDTTPAMVVFRRQFNWSRTASVGIFGGLFLIDATFFSANSLKFIEGGWVPLAFAIALVGIMTSWKRGRDLLLARWRQDSMPLAPFLARLPRSRSILRVPGLAVFLTGNQDYVPTSLLHNLKHNKVLHQKVMFVTVQTTDRPEEASAGRATVEELAPGIHRVMLRYGFMESPNIPRALEDLRPDAGFDAMQASYFLGREVLVPGMAQNLSWWRRWVFLWLARNAVPATEFFRIPSDRVVELGVRVAI
jgi:KUP system potassium uptake protein